MPTYASSDLVAFGLLAETTEGTFMTSAAFAQMLTNGISPEFSSNMVEDQTVSGAGEPVDKRTNLRGLNMQTPAQLRYKDLQLMVAAALRDTFPAEVSVVGSSNINVLTAGTHRDGSTGPQLSAPTGTFDSLITYGGVTATTNPDGGAEALMALLSGSANADNNRPRRIKAVWDNTTNAFIDFYPGYVGGSAGAFGAPFTGTTLESITVKVGQAGRNRIVGAGVKSFSALWNFTDMVNNGGWQSGFGLVANDLGLSWTGKDGAAIDIPWIGYGSGELVSADPSTQGFDDSALVDSPMMLAADDLQWVSIVTAAEPITLSQFNMTGLNFTLSGNSAAIDNVSGTSLVTGVRRGAHNPAGSLDWYLADDERVEKISQLGSQANAKKGGIDIGFKDPDGNWIIVGLLHNEFAPTGGVPGQGGNTVAGTLEFSGSRRTKRSRSFVWQEFAA